MVKEVDVMFENVVGRSVNRKIICFNLLRLLLVVVLLILLSLLS